MLNQTVIDEASFKWSKQYRSVSSFQNYNGSLEVNVNYVTNSNVIFCLFEN